MNTSLDRRLAALSSASLLLLSLTLGQARAQKVGDLYAPEAAPPDAQLQADETTVPADKGAIFVPALVRSADEPRYVVFRAKKKVATGAPGKRLLVAPGDYRLVLGSVDVAGRGSVEVPVTVEAGETTLVPPTWGVVRVDVVDERLQPVRSRYELLSMRTRQSLGTGLGADVRAGERLRAWVLPAGDYRLVEPGQTYRARKGFFSVHVPAGGLVRFRLVVDPSTNQFLGGGVVWADEYGSTDYGEGGFEQTTSVGFDATFSQTDKVVGTQDQLSFAGDVFVESSLRYDLDAHHWFAQAALVEGGNITKPAQGAALPFIKTTDRLELETGYTYLFKDWLGPYARLGLFGHLFPTDVLATEDTTVRLVEADGTSQTKSVAANETFRTSGALGVIQLRESIGANARLFDTPHLSLWTGLGIGARQNFYSGNYIRKDDPDTPERDYVASEDFTQLGLELSARLQATPFTWLLITGDLVLFDDFQLMDDPDLDFDLTTTFRVQDWLSVNYILSISRQPRLVDATQLEQKLMLRASLLF